MHQYNTPQKKSSGCSLPQISPALAARLRGWHLGVDEAGRGCLAGPVTAGAVLAPPGFDFAAVPELAGLTDSKKLSAAKREKLAAAIRQSGLIWAVGQAKPAEIDQVNILNATFRAMSRAVLAALRLAISVRAFDLPDPAELPLFVDGQHCIPLPQWQAARQRLILAAPPRQFAVVKGDSLIPAISAASIMAKTHRDALMLALHRRYPDYAFDQHKGYGTELHMQKLAALGPCPQHRLSFGPEKPVMQQASLF